MIDDGVGEKGSGDHRLHGGRRFELTWGSAHTRE